MLTYYSDTHGTRIKRRYVWGFWCFVIGVGVGVLVEGVLQANGIL